MDVMNEIVVKNELIRLLKADNERLEVLIAYNKDIREDNSQLIKDNKSLKETGNDGINDLNDVLVQLREENNKLLNENDSKVNECEDYIAELKGENHKLKCRINDGVIRNTTKELINEANEYFEHNPSEDSVYFFMVAKSEFEVMDEYEMELKVNDLSGNFMTDILNTNKQ